MITIVPPFVGRSYLVHELKGLSKGEIITLSRIGFSAGQNYFNGNYGPLQRHLRERTNAAPRVANMGRISAKAGLWSLAVLLEDVQLQRMASFSEKPPTPAEFIYQTMQDEREIWQDRFAGHLQRAVVALRQRLPEIQTSPYPPKAAPSKDSQPACRPGETRWTSAVIQPNQFLIASRRGTMCEPTGNPGTIGTAGPQPNLPNRTLAAFQMDSRSARA